MNPNSSPFTEAGDSNRLLVTADDVPVETGSAKKDHFKPEGRLTGWTWDGAPVFELKGTLAEVFPKVPVFTRHPFRVGEEENKYRDEIRRERLQLKEEPIPVATVSKGYSLVQHRDVLVAVSKALEIIGRDVSDSDSTLLLSEYGERMQWSCTIPGVGFTPGDGCPLVLQIHCLNSVDTSTSLEIAFSWKRLVCSNGLLAGMRETGLRRRHVQSLDPHLIAPSLAEQLDQVRKEESVFTEWLDTVVPFPAFEEWINGTLAAAWGPHAACRASHIVGHGYDGDVQSAKEKKPHQLAIANPRRVPGAPAEAFNLYHISQALSWIAGTRTTVTERYQYLKDITKLIEPLQRSLRPEGGDSRS